MKKLPITLKRKWFLMIASGEKREEYREIKPYWVSRLLNVTVSKDGTLVIDEFINWATLISLMVTDGRTNLEYWQKDFDQVVARNGYAKDAPTVTWVHKGIRIGKPNPAWCEPEDVDKIVFILDIGDIIKEEDHEYKATLNHN